jgi:hypothetical protein
MGKSGRLQEDGRVVLNAALQGGTAPELGRIMNLCSLSLPASSSWSAQMTDLKPGTISRICSPKLGRAVQSRTVKNVIYIYFKVYIHTYMLINCVKHSKE